MDHTPETYKSLSLKYVEACSSNKSGAVEAFLSPHLRIDGNVSDVRDAGSFVETKTRMGAAFRSRVRMVFAEGDEVCVFYDFIATGATLPAVERLAWVGNQITKITWFLGRQGPRPVPRL